jgi:hypothetical protein
MLRGRIIGTVALLILGVVWTTGSVSAHEQSDTTFTAKLTGDQQVPPVDTSATAKATFTLISHDQLAFTLELTSPTSSPILFAHIHLGAPGTNGGIIVNLCGTSDTPACGQSGVIAQGVITPEDFVGHLAGRSMSDLLTLMNEGNTYVNVHTQNFPSGEIRGQIEPSNGRVHNANPDSDEHKDLDKGHEGEDEQSHD